MSKLKWDSIGERVYETGVDHGVLFPMSGETYGKGVAWNGLTNVTESPSGAEPTKLYANNSIYATLMSKEEVAVTIEAYTYPDEFAACNGEASIGGGVVLGQQTRAPFGLAYRTKIGNDSDGSDHGYKIHIVYGLLASPSERAYATVNDSPEAITFSWEANSTPVSVNGHDDTSIITIDSTKIDASKLKTIEDNLFGSDSADAKIMLPDELITLLGAA